jgi:uracil-DNA glycosylase
MKRSNGWESILRSAECRDVWAQIAARRKKGERVYPIQQDVFRAFKDCPFEKVRVVILGQDPYAREGQAIGRAFAVPESTEKMPRSLKNIFEEVRRDYPHGEMPKPTLQSWANHGVLLLNTTLTVRQGSINSHSDVGWKEAVTIPTLEKLSAEREHLVFMLWGNHAKSFKQHILNQPRHLVLEASHPSPRSVKFFQKCGHFREANNYLRKHGIEPIIWTNEP